MRQTFFPFFFKSTVFSFLCHKSTMPSFRSFCVYLFMSIKKFQLQENYFQLFFSFLSQLENLKCVVSLLYRIERLPVCVYCRQVSVHVQTGRSIQKLGFRLRTVYFLFCINCRETRFSMSFVYVHFLFWPRRQRK